MAERRMFANSIIDSDLFLDMPQSAQCLYFHLAMRADDEGFVNAPKKIQRMIGASEDDCRLLVAKKFLIPFDTGVVVIRHWRIHNYIQKDRFKATMYQAERATLSQDKTGAYQLMDTNCIQDVSGSDTQVSIGKGGLGKSSEGKGSEGKGEKGRKRPPARFVPPTVEEVAAYCKERNHGIDAQHFVDYYSANGWVQGKGKPIKDWKAAVRTWERNGNGKMAEEARPQMGVTKKAAQAAKQVYQPTSERIQEQSDWLDKFLKEQEGCQSDESLQGI